MAKGSSKCTILYTGARRLANRVGLKEHLSFHSLNSAEEGSPVGATFEGRWGVVGGNWPQEFDGAFRWGKKNEGPAQGNVRDWTKNFFDAQKGSDPVF